VFVTNRDLKTKILLYFPYMPGINFTYHPQFFTATILEWKHLLKDDSNKDIIIKSIQFLKEEGSVVIFLFLIKETN